MNQNMHIYVDESGCLRANQIFVAGAWFTWKPDMWFDIIGNLRVKKGFWREMHFHKVSHKNNDRQYDMIQAVLAMLAKYSKSWYARFLYVGTQDQLTIWKNYSCVDIYDNLMGMLFNRFGGHFPEENATLILDEKNRPHWDNFIPVGLEEFLNNNVGVRTHTAFTVETANSKRNDLLQVSDILTAAMRQIYVPSTNPNKHLLAGTLVQVMDRIKVWDGH